MATIKFELELPFNSPYKRTRLYVKGGVAFFGVWRPIDVALDGDEEEVTIQRGLEGHLDLVAERIYGDRSLWRVIAHANKIDFPLEQVRVGMRLVVPKLANVRAALLAASRQIEASS